MVLVPALDTHINGVISGKLTKWHNDQISEQTTVTLAARKNQATTVFHNLRKSTIRRAFIESLLIPAMLHVPPPSPPPVTADEALTEIDSIMLNFNGST
jgi:hypothetical protein